MIKEIFPILKDLDNKNKMSVFIFALWMFCVTMCLVPYNYSVVQMVPNICNVLTFTVLFVVVGINARTETELEGIKERLGL